MKTSRLPSVDLRTARQFLILFVLVTTMTGFLITAPASAEPNCDVPHPPPICEEEEPPPPPGSPTGALSGATRLPTGLRVTGTAKDPDAAGSVTVHVYANSTYRGALQTTNGSFDGTVPVIAGHQQVCAIAVNRNKGTNTELGCRSLNVSVNPLGHLDEASSDLNGIRLRGWAIDPDTAAPIAVHLYVDSAGQAVTASRNRPDVGAAYPLYGSNHGFDTTIPAGNGVHTVCAYGINTGPGVNDSSGDSNTDLGCKTVTVQADPYGSVDQVDANSAVIRVRGWAIDPDSPRPVTVQVYANGRRLLGSGTASLDRPDVGAAYPGYGPAHGFDIALPTQPHTTLCVTAVNIGAGGDTVLGCGREKDSISVLTLNLDGSYSHSNGNGGETAVPWRERVDRVAAMRDTGNLPDVITLQDVHVIKVWPFPVPHADPANYEMLFELIARLKARTNADYRIAYVATGLVKWNGPASLEEGHAVLYNAGRLRNTTLTGLVGRSTMPDSDNTVTSVHLRTSFPCRDTSPQYAGWCGLLDGAGTYFTSPYTGTSGKWDMGPQAVLFEPLADQGKHVMVVNVHAHPLEDSGSLPAITDLVTVAGGAWNPLPKLYPPIIAGDFNVGLYEMWDYTAVTGQLAKYEIGGHSGVDNVLVGRAASFPSTRVPSASSLVFPDADPQPLGNCPNPTATLWSDHCAIYTQVLPRA
jgi:hypothetical protein